MALPRRPPALLDLEHPLPTLVHMKTMDSVLHLRRDRRRLPFRPPASATRAALQLPPMASEAPVHLALTTIPVSVLLHRPGLLLLLDLLLPPMHSARKAAGLEAGASAALTDLEHRRIMFPRRRVLQLRRTRLPLPSAAVPRMHQHTLRCLLLLSLLITRLQPPPLLERSTLSQRRVLGVILMPLQRLRSGAPTHFNLRERARGCL
jgi:hypothetical protein